MAANFADWVAITETKARYCRHLDGKDWAGYADCFTEDFELTTPGPGGTTVTQHGRDAALTSIRDAVETARTAHQVHNPEIVFAADGNSADVIWAMQDRVAWGEDRIAQMGDLGHTGYGHYREHYARCPDGKWRIKRQTLSYLHFDPVPLAT